MTIGIDIGGTKISGIVFNGKKIVSEVKSLTPKALPEFKTALKDMVLHLAKKQKGVTVGVAVAGVVDRKKGIVVSSPNLKIINGFNFIKFFRSLGCRQVKVENDANAFVLAESRVGQGGTYRSLVGLTLGTGIGGGIIMNNSLYFGAHGSAGEPGHMLANEKFTYEELYQSLKKKKDWRKAGKLLGRLSADLLNFLDSEAIVLGGSVGKIFGKQIVPVILKETKKHLLNKKMIPKIYVSKLKHAGAIGAALLLK